jgi:hypothetical protein
MKYDPKIHSISLDYDGKDILTLLDKIDYISPDGSGIEVKGLRLVIIYMTSEGKYRCMSENSDEIFADQILRHYK